MEENRHLWDDTIVHIMAASSSLSGLIHPETQADMCSLGPVLLGAAVVTGLVLPAALATQSSPHCDSFLISSLLPFLANSTMCFGLDTVVFLITGMFIYLLTNFEGFSLCRPAYPID